MAAILCFPAEVLNRVPRLDDVVSERRLDRLPRHVKRIVHCEY
jgi:hypothetical protein